MRRIKVICFKGKSNTGKTTVIKKILNKFFNIHICPNKKDFAIVFPYRNKVIGICSYGDALRVVKNKIIFFKSKRCEVIICACRTRGEVKDYIESQPNWGIKWIELEGRKHFDGYGFRKFKMLFNV